MTTLHTPATRTFPSLDKACRALAGEVADLIRRRSAEGRPAVLGLPTGSTPTAFYQELVRLHRDERLTLRNVITFNLDEYLGLGRDHPESYWTYMHRALFDHVDIPPAQVHIPDADVSGSGLDAHCRDYESAIRRSGGIDLMILGIGRTGHIGFNEPGSPRESRTRVVSLCATTREDAAGTFGGIDHVPRRAITMGVASILECRRIVLLAGGGAKADIVRHALTGPIDADVPATYLLEHPETAYYLDEAAAGGL